MAEFNLNDGLLIAATVLGPVLAVQAQKWVERATENRRRKVEIFETLMATRAARLTPEHVRALNKIDLVFNKGWILWASAREKEKAVIAAWRTHLDNMNHSPFTKENTNPEASVVEAWSQRCTESIIELLLAMSQTLGYDFDRVQVRRGVYHPQGYVDIDTALNEIRQGLVKVLAGQRPIPMNVVSFPVDKELVALQVKINEHILKALSGEGALYVATKDDGKDVPSSPGSA